MFERLRAYQSRLQRPTEALKAITDKILAWKARLGDQQVQAAAVAKKLQPKESVTVLTAKTVLRKLAELQTEIKLTDDDITMILFTSLDHDHLTDLVCLPGELLRWFTTEFAGESTEESDFLASKQEIWEATVSLAQ